MFIGHTVGEPKTYQGAHHGPAALVCLHIPSVEARIMVVRAERLLFITTSVSYLGDGKPTDTGLWYAGHPSGPCKLAWHLHAGKEFYAISNRWLTHVA